MECLDQNTGATYHHAHLELLDKCHTLNQLLAAIILLLISCCTMLMSIVYFLNLLYKRLKSLELDVYLSSVAKDRKSRR